MRYLTARADHQDEAGYRVKDGVLVHRNDDLPPPTTRRRRKTILALTAEQRERDEARFAELCGPVTVRRATKAELKAGRPRA